jgi:hypothetical protein
VCHKYVESATPFKIEREKLQEMSTASPLSVHSKIRKKRDKKSCNPVKLSSKPGLQGPNTFWQPLPVQKAANDRWLSWR